MVATIAAMPTTTTVARPRPLFVPFGAAVPERSLAVDGTVGGTAATYSHWQGGHVTPPELLADTSTGMTVLAAREPERWLAPYRHICNNHVDADGILSMLACCRPDLARAHGALMVAAAACGDFVHWHGPAACDLALRVHQIIGAERSGGVGWEQRALDRALANADALIAGDWNGASVRRAGTSSVESGIAWLNAHPPLLRGRLAVVAWARVHGHADDHFAWLDDPGADDLPLLALSTAVPHGRFQLLLEAVKGTGKNAEISVRLDAPRHSWARTVDLPAVPWPDLGGLQAMLSARDPVAGWTARPQASELGFTCLLGTRQPTRLPAEAVIELCCAAVG